MLNSRYLFFLIVPVFTFSCKKDNNQPEEPAACNSVDVTANDTFPVLFVTKEGTNMAIHQLKNGIQTSLISDPNYDFWWPKYSPDKQQILCYRSPGNDVIELNDFSQAQLWKFNADGTGGHMILQLSDYGWNAMGYAQWAPGGKKIVMGASNEDAADNNNVHWHLYVTDTAGNGAVKISNRSSYFSYPDISPDFTHITYCAYPSPLQTGTVFETELHVANLDTTTWTISSEVRATNNTRAEEHANYSSDGLSIAFYSYSGNNDFSIHTSTFTGGTITNIPTGGRYMSQPVFKNSNQLFFVLRQGSVCLNHIARSNETGGNELPYYRKLNQHFYQPEL
jgi:Tol biopolymer transport system component